jgi:hypothetical protein
MWTVSIEAIAARIANLRVGDGMVRVDTFTTDHAPVPGALDSRARGESN